MDGSLDGKKIVGTLTQELRNANEQALAVLATFKQIQESARNFRTPSQGNSIAGNSEQAYVKANAAIKEQERLLKAIATQQARNNLVSSNAAKIVAQQRVELQQANKANRETAIIESKNTSEYKRQSTILNQLRDRYKSLLVAKAQGVKLSKAEQRELSKLAGRVKQLDSALKKADAAAGQFNRNVGNYPKGLALATRSLRAFAGAFGFTSGIFIFASALKDAFKRIREFDKSMQNLAGVLRTTRDEIQPIEQEIITVAGASIKTSREVAGLAESLATLGKRGQDLINLIKPANDLSIALGTSSEEAAEFLVQNLNAFGDSSDEADRYADTIATIRTSTSLDFQRMRDSFQYLTPISRILGEDLAFTGGITGVLSDNSIKAEQGARLLGTAQQKLAKDGVSLNDALDQINEAQEKGAEGLELLALASGLFGKQAAKVGIVLANNRDKIEQYAESIRSAEGALDDLVGEQLKSLDAQLAILDSTWERLIITVENGNGAFAEFFKGATLGITGYLEELIAVEEAQSKVFSITGEEGGFAEGVSDVLKGITFTLVDIKTEYEDLVDLQREFNRFLGSIDSNTGLEFLSDEINTLNQQIKNNNDLSEEQRKLYEAQRDAVQKVYDANLEYRQELESQAREIVDVTGKFDDFGSKIEILSNEILRDFIAKNKDVAKSISAINDEFEENDFVSLDKLKAKLKDLKEAFGQADIEGTEFQNLKTEIAELEAQIATLEGRGRKGRKVVADAIEGTIARYNQLIKKEQEYQTNTATTREEFQKSQRKIDSYREAIDKLTRAFDVLEKVDVTNLLRDINDFDKATPIAQDLLDVLNNVAEVDLRKTQGEIKNLVDELTKTGALEGLGFELGGEAVIDPVDLSGLEGEARAAAFKAAEEAKRFEAKKTAEYQKALLQNVLFAAQDIYGIDLQGFILALDDKEAALEDYAQASRETLLSLNDAILDGTLNRLDQEREQNERTLDLILQDKDISEKKKEQAEAEYRKKDLEIRKKQFKAEQKAAIARTVINTAVAIIQAYAQLGPIGGTIAGVLISALGMVQLATIRKQKPPEFFKGKKATDNFQGIGSVNEKPGQREVGIDDKGNVSLFPAGKHYRQINRKDIIIPSIKEYDRQIQDPASDVFKRVSRKYGQDAEKRINLFEVRPAPMDTKPMEKMLEKVMMKYARRPINNNITIKNPTKGYRV